MQAVDSIAGTVTFGYDGLDRLTAESNPRGSLSYTYDNGSRRSSMTVAGQSAVNYTYDDADRLTQITAGSSIAAFTYDASGRRTTLTLPNAITTTYSYDGASELTGMSYQLGASSLGDLAYGYDLAGRRTSVAGTFARTALPAALASTTYNGNNQLVQRAGTSFTYDLNGNLTGDGVNTYTWDARNHLVAMSGDGGRGGRGVTPGNTIQVSR
jgi:YD repeat-containing protein